MGCLTFLCNECGKVVSSNGISGDSSILFLLKDGKVIEKMRGDYDSVGAVFIGKSRTNIRKSKKWNMEWEKVCNLINSRSKKTGLSAIHSKCFKKIPTVKSKDENKTIGYTYF